MKSRVVTIAAGFLALFVCACIFTPKTYAASLMSLSATVSASRPSASSPIAADIAAGVSTVAIDSNGSTFLSSDSAKLWGQSQETVTIATTSANKLSLFFTGNTANLHSKGSAIVTPITALHTIAFRTVSAIPSGGTITIAYPNSLSTDANVASPSAATFMTNGLSNSNILVKFGAGTTTATCVLTTAGTGGAAPLITCTTATADLPGGTMVTIQIGCKGLSDTSCKPTDQVPTLINPTKTAAAGTADVWSVVVSTLSGANILDSGKAKVGTVESVMVVAHIEPSFTFVINGVANGQTLNAAGYCADDHGADTSNSGFATTSTDVNLGTLTASQINRAHQTMKITSNAINGYAITATSSGHMVNPANGFFLPNAQGDPSTNNTPVPAALPAVGNARFGIHACDRNSKVNQTFWGNATASFANPSKNFLYTLVNSITAPADAGDITVVEYAGMAGNSTPPGDYWEILTYTASATF